MRIGICLALFGLLCGIGVQAQPVAPQDGKLDHQEMLSAKQIAEGWIQLFDGATDYGWKPRGDAKWTVLDGTLRCEAGQPGYLCTSTEFGVGELHFECMQGSVGNSGVAVHAPTEGMIDPKNSTLFYHKASGAPKSATWTSYDVSIKEGRIDMRVNGKSDGDYQNSPSTRGCIGLFTDGQATVQYRNIRFKPAGLKSVFNGKDLTGWIAPEGNKSVFTVTKEGWLNLKGGRGDLQTIDQWGDFVLQIDVYSNGDHLNSGVFFRAEAGKFEQGYEDQIRNEWQGDDRTKPVDYGTGAVYNRLPVRKVVSSDREWFTMTLIAHGNHIGSWVNGVLVCDFTDTRPPDQTNARKGARTKAGVISLQGHEPATDLNFRNIRIAELPSATK